MSHYTQVKTTYKSISDLVGAHCECGFTEDQIQVSEENDMTLYGWKGKTRRGEDGKIIKGAVRIAREFVGSASNDIGFIKEDDGTYTAIISQYDTNNYGQPWQNKLKREYNARIATRQLKRKGYRVNITRTENNIRVEGKM